MKLKKVPALALKILCIIFTAAAFSTGCKSTKAAPVPTPVATATPVPHREKIIFTFNGNMFWMDPDGTNRQEIFPDSNSKWFPSVSPDGYSIAYWVQNRTSYNIWVADLHKQAAYPVTFNDDTFDSSIQNFNFRNAPCFTPDSKYIIYAYHGDIWKMTRDGYDQVALTSTHNCFSPAISRDNRLVFVLKESYDTCNLYMQGINGQEPEKITNQSGKKAGSPAFSPDGRKIIYTVQDNDSINIFMVDPSVKSEDQLTFDGKSNSPAFSYDGTRIIYSNYLNNKYQPDIWMMNIDKTNRIKLTSEGGVSPVWLYQVLDAPLPANTPAASMAAKPEKEETVFDIKEAAAGAAALPVFTPVNPGTYVANDGLTDKLKVTTIQQGNKLLFYPVIHYDSALANIKPEFKPALDYMADILKAESSPIIIEGHTDNLPIKTKKYPSNYELSLARANSVKNYLVKHKGIAASRITVTGYGDSKPLVVNNTEINRYKNRRAQVVVITVVSEPAAKNTPVNVKVSVQNPANAAAPSNTPAVTAAVTPAPATTPETAAPVKVQFNSNSQKSIGW